MFNFFRLVNVQVRSCSMESIYDELARNILVPKHGAEQSKLSLNTFETLTLLIFTNNTTFMREGEIFGLSRCGCIVLLGTQLFTSIPEGMVNFRQLEDSAWVACRQSHSVSREKGKREKESNISLYNLSINIIYVTRRLICVHMYIYIYMKHVLYINNNCY